MKTSIAIILVAAAMSVTTTGYAKLFDDEQLESLFQTDDNVFEISLKSSDIPGFIVLGGEIAIQPSLKIDLVNIIDNELLLGTSLDSNSTCEDIEGCFEYTAFNAGRLLEFKTVSDNAIFAKVNSWANTYLLLCTSELSDSCSLMLLTITR